MMRVGAFLRRCRQKVANAGVHDGPCDGARDLWFVVQVCAHVEYRADYRVRFTFYFSHQHQKSPTFTAASLTSLASWSCTGMDWRDGLLRVRFHEYDAYYLIEIEN